MYRPNRVGEVHGQAYPPKREGEGAVRCTGQRGLVKSAVALYSPKRVSEVHNQACPPKRDVDSVVRCTRQRGLVKSALTCTGQKGLWKADGTDGRVVEGHNQAYRPKEGCGRCVRCTGQRGRDRVQDGLGETENSSFESLDSSCGASFRRRLTRVHTLVEEDRTFGCSPNPLLQPPLVPTG